MRRIALLACLLAVPGLGPGGGGAPPRARGAPPGDRPRGGQPGGAGPGGPRTPPQQQQFLRAAIRTNAQFRGRNCAQVMQAALDSISPAQLRQFSGAKIEDVQVDGDKGTFRYTLGQIRVDGQVAKEDGDWKVSCCVPGQ